MIDSRIPRFSQGVQAVVLAVAFLLDWIWAVPILAVILFASVLGGPSWNLLALLYRALPIAPGEMEAAGPPRFAQMLGTAFLTVGSIALVTAEEGSTTWWALGWAPALAVAVLSALAATTSF